MTDHDGPWPKFCPQCLTVFHEDGTFTPATDPVAVPATGDHHE